VEYVIGGMKRGTDLIPFKSDYIFKWGTYGALRGPPNPGYLVHSFVWYLEAEKTLAG
jgi:hypothetical protein